MCTSEHLDEHAQSRSDQNLHLSHIGYPRMQSIYMRSVMSRPIFLETYDLLLNKSQLELIFFLIITL